MLVNDNDCCLIKKRKFVSKRFVKILIKKVHLENFTLFIKVFEVIQEKWKKELFKNYMDKMRRVGGQKYFFLFTFRVKHVHVQLDR